MRILPLFTLTAAVLVACGDKDTDTPSTPDTNASGGADTAPGEPPDTGEPAAVDEDGDGYTDDVDCDDGDPEVNPGATEACNSVDDDCDGASDEGWIPVPADGGDLQAIVDEAPDGSALCLAAGTWSGPLVLSERTLTIAGAGPDETILDGDRSARVVEVSGGAVTLSGVGLRNGWSNIGVGLWAYDAEVRLSEVSVSGSLCPESGTSCTGGGIALDRSSGSLEDVTISGVQTAAKNTVGTGLAIRISPEVALRRVTISGNTAGSCDNSCLGALYIDTSTASLEDVTISGNTSSATGTASTVRGSGLVALLSTVTGQRVRIVDNRMVVGTQSFSGGVLAGYFQSRISLENVVIANNTVEGSSAGVGVGPVFANVDSDISLTNADIVGNESGTGGALYIEEPDDFIGGGGEFYLTNVNISDNTAAAGSVLYGGGEADALVLSSCNLYNNIATDGTESAGGGNLTASASELLRAAPGHTDTSGAQAAGWDLSLRTDSLLRDAGAPDILDADGSASDIGAHGGPGGW